MPAAEAPVIGRRASVEILAIRTTRETERVLRNVLWQTMPRNLATRRYERYEALEDKAKFLKHLINIHPGEVREIWGEWVQGQTPLPDDSSWYHPAHAKGELVAGEVNTFLWKGRHSGEHWQRRATGFSLPRLFDLSRNQYTAEVIYEAFKAPPPLVSKRSRRPRPRRLHHLHNHSHHHQDTIIIIINIIGVGVSLFM